MALSWSPLFVTEFPSPSPMEPPPRCHGVPPPLFPSLSHGVPLPLIWSSHLSHGVPTPLSLMECPLPSLSWSSPLSHGVPLCLSPMEFPSLMGAPLSHIMLLTYIAPLHPACRSPQQPCPKQPRPKQPCPKQPTFRCLPSSPNVTYTAKPLPKFQI